METQTPNPTSAILVSAAVAELHQCDGDTLVPAFRRIPYTYGGLVLVSVYGHLRLRDTMTQSLTCGDSRLRKWWEQTSGISQLGTMYHQKTRKRNGS